MTHVAGSAIGRRQPNDPSPKRQGNRVLTEEDFEKVVLAPAGLQAFALDADFEAGLLLEQVVGNLAQAARFWGA